MRKLALAALLVLAISPAQACNITISLTTASPVQNFSKTWTDTDANCVLALQAVSASVPTKVPLTPAQSALLWAQNAVSQLVQITEVYQRNNATITPINPQ